MSGQDPDPPPYGALQYYQVHFIVEVPSDDNEKFLAKCEPITSGRFGNRRVAAVRWTGVNKFPEMLQADSKLTDMLKEVMLREGEIRVDPQDDHVRIYGKWRHEDKFGFNETMLEIADRIAMHIKKELDASGIKA